MIRFHGSFSNAADILREFRVSVPEWREVYEDATCDGCGRELYEKLMVERPVEMDLCRRCGEAWLAAGGELDDADVIFACYTYEDYSGKAWVLFKLSGMLYEAHGSHCSCNGLEDQWEPEETTLEAILMRPLEGWGVEARELRRWILVNVLTDVTVEQLADFLQSNSREVREAAMLRIGNLRHHAA